MSPFGDCDGEDGQKRPGLCRKAQNRRQLERQVWRSHRQPLVLDVQEVSAGDSTEMGAVPR